MGHKSVCIDCRKAYNNFIDLADHKKEICPDCCGKMHFINQLFKPPKRTEIKKWQVVKFLIESGFDYSRTYEMIKPGVYLHLGKYPETMKEAMAFVQNFQTNGVKK